MFDETSAAELLTQLKETREDINKAGAERQTAFKRQEEEIKKFGAVTAETKAMTTKLADLMAELQIKCQTLEEGLNEVHKRQNRPGADKDGTEKKERAEAIDHLRLIWESRNPKIDPENQFNPTEDKIAEAIVGRKALDAYWHTTDQSTMPEEYRKSLSAFNFGNNGFFMSPEISNRVLSCLIDQTDIVGFLNSITISGPSIRFMIDNMQIHDQAAWACETSCFANNPQPNLAGLGELEIKPETLRYIVCATRDLIEDASINVEQWMVEKVRRAFRNAITVAVICGDGVGRPVGILNPASGIPICDTAPATPPGTLTWQDLIMLAYQVPMQYHNGGAGCSYWMNQHTFALCLTMTDAMGRPIFQTMPERSGTGLTLGGFPVHIVTQMPDVAPGSTPVAFGNWNEVYMIVNRKAVTMQQDPYSAGYCILWKFEARIGGAILCPGAARLLRIR